MTKNTDGTLPQISFGSYTVSRLILGANPINSGSHLSWFMDQRLLQYFTPERVMNLLTRCNDTGINTWQSGTANLNLYRRYRQEGGDLQYISLASEDPDTPDIINRIVDAGAIAIAHHGEDTDHLYKSGQIEKIQDFLDKVHDIGVMAGVSTHMPSVVEYIESENWDLDFFMTCVYERNRTREELKALLGYVPIPQQEVYLEEDPPRMFKAMRQTSKPCLAYKILAAGRLCDRQEYVENAFESTFRQIKPNDALIVGMYPEYEDQVSLNADYVRRFSRLSKKNLDAYHPSELT